MQAQRFHLVSKICSTSPLTRIDALSDGIPKRFRPLIHLLALVGLLIGIHVPTAKTHHADNYQTIATIKPENQSAKFDLYETLHGKRCKRLTQSLH